MIYISCPYTHKDKKVRIKRFEIANKYAAKLIEKGEIVYSPLSHCHPISEFMSKENVMNHELWMKQDLDLMDNATELHVLCVDGWDKSRGVANEVRYAVEMFIPIIYIEMRKK